METMPPPVEISEGFHIDWLLSQVRKQKLPCFEGKTPMDCETILLRLRRDGYTLITTANGVTTAS